MITFLLVWYLSLVVLLSMWLVFVWPGFYIRSLVFVVVRRYFCPLMSQQAELSVLGFPRDLLYMPCSGFEAFKFLGKLLQSSCRELVHVNAVITDGPGHKLFVFMEKTEDVPVEYFRCFWGVLGQICLCLYIIVPLIDAMISLSKAFQ